MGEDLVTHKFTLWFVYVGMTVRVNFYSSYLKEASGTESIHISEEPKTVGELLDLLAAKLGAKFEERVYDSKQKVLKRAVVLLVNGHSVKMLQGMDTPLTSGDNVTIDTVEIVEIVGGG